MGKLTEDFWAIVLACLGTTFAAFCIHNGSSAATTTGLFLAGNLTGGALAILKTRGTANTTSISAPDSTVNSTSTTGGTPDVH